MMRYLGYILIVVSALGWSIGVIAILIGQFGDRLGSGAAMELAGFDRPMVARGPPVALCGFLLDADGIPSCEGLLVFRFEDGWTAQAPLGCDDGIACVNSPAGLSVGAHRFTVDLPDARPRLDVRGYGTAWAWPADTRVVWIDVAAVFPLSEAARTDGKVGALRDEAALGAVKTLAAGRLPVYLVCGQMRVYPSVRRLVEMCGAPRGPVVWVKPGSEAASLAGTRGVWPRIDVAALSTPALADAAGRLKIEVRRAPQAGQSPGASPGAASWEDVLRGLPAPAGAGAQEVK